jgi:hypothetical protein
VNAKFVPPPPPRVHSEFMQCAQIPKGQVKLRGLTRIWRFMLINDTFNDTFYILFFYSSVVEAPMQVLNALTSIEIGMESGMDAKKSDEGPQAMWRTAMA